MARTDPDNITCTKLLAPSKDSISARCSTLVDDDSSDVARRIAADSLVKELDAYLAEPTLLDAVLPTLVQTLTASFTVKNLARITAAAVDDDDSVSSVWALPYTVLQVAQKVRGAKLVLKHYPHSVGDLDTVIDLIIYLNDATDGHAHEYWRINEVLFCWLANVVLIPFPLLRLVKSPGILGKLEEIAFNSLHSSSTAHFLARLSTRADCDATLKSVVKKSMDMISSESSSNRHNSLNLLAKIFKVGQRNIVLLHAATTLQAVTHVTEELKYPSTLDMHLATKLAQRIAQAYLPPRVCSWRYQRGSRFLFGGDGADEAGAEIQKYAAVSKPNGSSKTEEEDSLNISTEAQKGVEVALGVVLGSLENRDAIVRWSGAKGVGRIVSRLDSALGTEVISHVIETFTRNPNDEASWNGACLSLAEVLRRGLLLPDTPLFKSMVGILEAACNFDVRRGAHSVGEHVRDAACYVVWALARAYNSADIQEEFIDRIVHAILKVALFDREVHCRRAASAALQECVGRMPSAAIKDGIFIITQADFFALGDRTAAYLKIAPNIARAADGAYFNSIITQLELKLSHWDYNIRLLAARGLREQLENDADGTIVTRIIPNLVSKSTGAATDAIHRHGCILGVAKIIPYVPLDGNKEIMKKEDLTKLINVWKVLDRDGCFNGRTGVLLEAAVCELIQAIADTLPAAYAVDGDEGDYWTESMGFLERCLPSTNATVQNCADSAFRSMLQIGNMERYSQAEKHYSELMMVAEPLERQRGFVLSAGWFSSSELILANLKSIARDSKDVEVRRNAVISLGRLELEKGIFEVLENSMADYTVDDRGDVGSWIREAAMESAAGIVERMPSVNNGIVGIMAGIARQCLERIDRTRFVAAQALDRIVNRFGEIEETDNNGDESVRKVFEAIISAFQFDATLPEDEAARKEVLKERFMETKSVFSCGINLLEMDVTPLHTGVLRGMVASAGGKGHQNTDSMAALLSCERPKLVEEISAILVPGQKTERLYVPALNVMYALLLETYPRNTNIDSELVVRRVRANWKGRMRDVKHMAAAAAILGELSGGEGLEALEALTVVLGCGVPRIRRVGAETLYVALLEQNNPIDMAVDIVLDTRWEKLGVADARARRNELCDALDVKKPTVTKKK